MATNRREFIRSEGAGLGGRRAGLGPDDEVVGPRPRRRPRPRHRRRPGGPDVLRALLLEVRRPGPRARTAASPRSSGNPEHPLSRGRLCPRGTGGTGLLYDPDRLKKPLLRRRGARASRIFEEVSWEKALDFTAEKLLKHQEGRAAPTGRALLPRLRRLVGSSTSSSPTARPTSRRPRTRQCRGPREVGFELTFGAALGSPEVLDIANARCLTLIGSHLGENMHNTQVQDFAPTIATAAPSSSSSTRASRRPPGKARYWLPIKPGTDMALLLAWMHVIRQRGALRPRLRREVRRPASTSCSAHVADKTPEWAFTETTIPARGDRRDGALHRRRPPRVARPPGPPRDLVRRRHPALARHRDPERAPRARGAAAAGFFVPTQMSVPKYPVPDYAEKREDGAGPPRRRHLPVRRRGPRARRLRRDDPGPDARQGLPDQGLDRLRHEPPPGAAAARSRRRRRSRSSTSSSRSTSCRPRSSATPTSCCRRRPTSSAGTTSAPVPWSRAVPRHAAAGRPADVRQQAGLVDRQGARAAARTSAHYFPWDDGEEIVDASGSQAGGYDVDDAARRRASSGRAGPRHDRGRASSSTFATPIEEDRALLEADGRRGPRAAAAVHAAPSSRPTGSSASSSDGRPTHTFGRTTNNRFLSEVYAENEVWLNAKAAERAGPARTARASTLANQDGVRSHAGEAQGHAADPARLRLHRPRLRAHEPGAEVREGTRASTTQTLVTRIAVDPIAGTTGMNVNFVTIEKARARRPRLEGGGLR